MDVVRVFVVLTALLALAGLPCIIAWIVLHVDEASDHAGEAMAKLRPGSPSHPPVAATAATLRRVSRALGALPESAATRRGELTDEYDAALRQACATLGIPHRLTGLSGMDLVAERLRVEGTLEQRGLVLRDHADRPDTKELW